MDNYPSISTGPLAVYQGADGVGFTYETKVLVGAALPPPRRVLLGGNVSLAMKAQAAGAPVGVVRRYYGMAATHGYDPQGAAKAVAADASFGAKTLLSIGPGDNKAAPYDTKLMEPYRTAIEAPTCLAIPWHEPENDGQPTSVYHAFFSAFAQQFPKAQLVPVLMAWTYLNNNQAQWLDGLPDFEYLGTDPYIHKGQTAASQYDPSRLEAEKRKKQLVIAETGVLSTEDQVAGLADMAAYCQKYPSVYALAYWSQVGKAPYDWTLGAPGVTSFCNLLKSAPFAPIK